jgi:hypothetical protein
MTRFSTLLLVLLASASSLAWAQDDLAGATPGERQGADVARTFYTTAAVDLTRFPDTPEVITRSVAAAEAVTLVVLDGNVARVRVGTDFGWVDFDSLSALPPMPGLPPIPAGPN